MESIKIEPDRGWVYSAELRSFISGNPGVIRRIGTLIEGMVDVELNHSETLEDLQATVTLLGYHSDADRTYYRVDFDDESHGHHAFFIKKINNKTKGDHEDGVKEFKNTRKMAETLSEYDDKVRVVEGVMGINIGDRSYFVSKYEEVMISGYNLDNLMDNNPVLEGRLKKLKEFLQVNGYTDVQWGNMGYDDKKDEIIVFDVTI